MVYFHPNVGKFWSTLEWKMVGIFYDDLDLWHSGDFYGHSIFLWLFGIFFPFWYKNFAALNIRTYYIFLVEPSKNSNTHFCGT
jgi:hypothetical protein